jgi:hypothetical protein
MAVTCGRARAAKLIGRRNAAAGERYAHGRRATCESCLSIDVRQWHRLGWLRAGQRFTWSWTRGGKALGSVVVRTEPDAVILMFKPSGAEGNGSRSVEQRLPLVWTRCHFGGARPWLRCTGHSDGQACGRRAAKLFLCPPPLFACRPCCGLAYASQQEIPRHRAISRAQKARMRLGGNANLLEPFPKKPRGMHRRTYNWMLAGAMAAQERWIALSRDWLHRRSPVFCAPRTCPDDLGYFTSARQPIAGAHDRRHDRARFQ